MSDEVLKSDHRPAGVGPGERLQAARIQQGLSLEDVANRMHLSVNILESIEENNFEEITAPIFVKGYLRAYARIVSLDEDEMIQQYMDYYSEEDPPITSTSNMAPELSVADARIKWTTYLVVIGLAALLAAWWWNKEQNQEAPISLEAQSTTSEQESVTQSEVASSEIAAVSETEVDMAEEQAPAPAAVTESENEQPDTAMTDPVETESLESEPDQTAAVDSEQSSSDEQTSLEPPPVIQEITDESGLVTRLAPGGSDKLLIIVNADTWADIKDGADYQMVYDLLRADQTLQLTGEAPFKVFFGNGHGVEVRFNGEDVEIFSRVRDDNTARLKIGG